MKYSKTAIVYRLTGVLIIAALLILAMLLEETSEAKNIEQPNPTLYQLPLEKDQSQNNYSMVH